MRGDADDTVLLERVAREIPMYSLEKQSPDGLGRSSGRCVVINNDALQQ